MALTIHKDTSRVFATGTPTSTTAWEKLDVDTGAEHFKVRALVGWLEWSFNGGNDVHGRLEAGETETFPELRCGKYIWVRGTAAPARIWAWA